MFESKQMFDNKYFIINQYLNRVPYISKMYGHEPVEKEINSKQTNIVICTIRFLF